MDLGAYRGTRRGGSLMDARRNEAAAACLGRASDGMKKRSCENSFSAYRSTGAPAWARILIAIFERVLIAFAAGAAR